MKFCTLEDMRAKTHESPVMARSYSSRLFGNFSKTLETDSTDIHLAENEELKRKYQNIQEENMKLQAVITDLTQVNKRWQKYNNDRQMYVQKLLNTIQDQQEQLNQISEVRAFSKSQAYSDSSFSSSSTSGELCESALDRLKSVEQKLKERVELLEFQVKAHRDDWEAELNEKRQALQDKEAAERRATDLLTELQSLKTHLESLERRKTTVICHCCGQPCSTVEQPLQNRLYRTALHLPYPSGRSDERTAVSEIDDIVVDSSENVYNANNSSNNRNGELLINITEDPKLLQLEENKLLNTLDTTSNNSRSPYASHQSSSSSVRDLWDIQQPGASKLENEISYSRSSTVPLINSPGVQTTASGTSLHEETAVSTSYNKTNGQQMVTSSVRIPITKSSSAPVRKTNKPSVRDLPRMSLDSIKFSATSPPITLVNTAAAPASGRDATNDFDGIETLTSDDVICPGCGTVFPPKLHLKFLDHFESCQTANRNNNSPNSHSNSNNVLESTNRY